jgi:hypothetical protein
MISGIIDIAAASVLMTLAYGARYSHWYWPLMASAAGILLGNLGWSLLGS